MADLIPGEGSGGGVPVVGIMGNIWACLEIEDECVFRVMMEELRRIVLRILARSETWGWHQWFCLEEGMG